ncbi:DUF3093 domain-containing protein [Paeniglutamicibacter cryotolerans]|uniref:DUF3093 domain-containing protein n=1 Tax=Paeniglutamicibacter cryotolerans TaxID=670079 RepID=A0A839QRT8_9MICC|nr:DUF3093 domain-containing protein [Paeniglutamicibacter cryotolerans]MBB2996686.1 hypothetical protein [Paeniglutamicibacter cryotolerans]
MHENTSAPVSATVQYSEKLWPAWWIWIVVLGLAGTASVAFVPIGLGVGLTAGIFTLVTMLVLLMISTPSIIVTDTRVQVGRASIEREFIGAASAHRSDDAFQERGPRLNATAFMCIRGWIDPVVRIEITDERDSTPYWLTSTRRPEELVKALEFGGTPAH